MSNDRNTSDRGAEDDGQVDDLTRALLPTVEKAIGISVRRDSRPLVNAIFPVMGPAIRKSIAEALRSMVQSLSRSLEHSFSIRGLRWRIQAWRTGRPFAEVVLLNSLVYRVEQVFLIHRETGLLLQHVQPGVDGQQDADMVSAMLTAIRDFVRDSFSPDGAGSLETIRMGDVNVWVEDGPKAILAAVVRGTAPESMRSVFSGAQETIHQAFGTELESFAGDTAAFEAARPVLEGCLGEQQKATRQRVNPLVFVVPLLIVAGIVAVIWCDVSRDRAWDETVRFLQYRPGVVVFESRRDGSGGFIRGVSDPAAGGFDDLFAARGWDPSLVRQDWIPVEVGFGPYELNRITKALSPPPGVSLDLSGDWTLTIKGQADHQFIERAAIITRVFSRIAAVDMSGLEDIDRAAASALADSVRAAVHGFDVASGALSPAEAASVQRVAADIVALERAARRAHLTLDITVVGRADPTGADARNRVLSRERADSVAALLIDAGVDRHTISTDGLGTTPLGSQPSGHNRCVTYSIRMEPVFDD